MTVETSLLLARLPADYAIVKARDRAAELARQGRDPINLSIGDPELVPPASLLAALVDACADQSLHARYPRIEGTAELREAFAAMCARRYGHALDPEREVLPLIGAKEGLVHLVLALAGPSLPVYLPSVGYPVYQSAARMAGAPILSLGGSWEDGYQPTLPHSSLVGGVVVVGSPANPTGAVVDGAHLDQLVTEVRARGALLCFDAAYCEISGSGARAPLPIARAGVDRVVEIHSISKSLGLPGWRVAFAVGDARAIAALKRLKSFVDSGIPGPLQRATARALPSVDGDIDAARTAFVARHGELRATLAGLGLEIYPSDAGMFAWVRVRGLVDDALARALDEEAVIGVDGVAFGAAGAGCVRLSVSAAPSRLRELRRRVSRALVRVSPC